MIRCEDKDSNYQCINGQCLTLEVLKDKPHFVVVAMNDTEFITTEVITVQLKNMSGIDEFVIVVEYDDEGRIVQIAVYVNDKPNAVIIEKSINDNCQGIFCRAEEVCIRENTSFLSLSESWSLKRNGQQSVIAMITSVLILASFK